MTVSKLMLMYPNFCTGFSEKSTIFVQDFLKNLPNFLPRDFKQNLSLGN